MVSRNPHPIWKGKNMAEKDKPTGGPPMSHIPAGQPSQPPAPKPSTGPGGPPASHVRPPEAPSGGGPAIIATHTLKEGETLSHLAVQYYGNPSKPFWSLIYEANKEVIGASERYVKVGMVLKIPKLPPSLAGKTEIKK
jgi:nucleoid-associated protein YgaU